MNRALTIGVFDAVHLGHQYLLRELKKRGTAVVVTFSNHPASILRPPAPPLIHTLEERIALLKKYGADEVVVLPFTYELSQKTHKEFLEELQNEIGFTHLVLGVGSVFGKGAEGTQERIEKMAKTFKVVYLPKLTFNGETVSSSKIRQLQQNGHFEQAKKLIGTS